MSDSEWSEWYPLRNVTSTEEIPQGPGIYRIREVGTADNLFIEETGQSIRGRVAQLTPLYGPYQVDSKRHTALSGLQDIRDQTGCNFEVSFFEMTSTAAVRKAQETIELFKHRMKFGYAPALNFGAHHIAEGVREEPLPELDYELSDQAALNWCGLEWIPFDGSATQQEASGVYRGLSNGVVEVIGQGKVARQISFDQKAAGKSTAKAKALSTIDVWEFVPTPALTTRQRLELVNDLIALATIGTSKPPAAQFAAD
jgi:hypothetical protein